MDDRLAHQIAFLIEADKLKTIIRRTPLVDRFAVRKLRRALVAPGVDCHGDARAPGGRLRSAARVRVDGRAQSRRNRRRRHVRVRRGRSGHEARAGDRRGQSDLRASSAGPDRSLSRPVGRVRGTGHAGSALRPRRGPRAAPPAERLVWRRKLDHARRLARSSPSPHGTRRVDIAGGVAGRARDSRLVPCVRIAPRIRSATQGGSRLRRVRVFVARARSPRGILARRPKMAA